MMPASGFLIETGNRCAPQARCGGQVENIEPRAGHLPADTQTVKFPLQVHGRADARPSRSAAGAGNEGTGHARLCELRRFSDVAGQV